VATPLPLAVHFAAPAWLLALLVVPVGAVLYVLAERRRARGRAAFAAPALLPAVAPHRPGWRRHLPMAFYAVAVAALAVALARPERTVAVPVEQASIVLTFDRSGSMAATDVKPNRMEAARRAADQFLRAVPKQVRVGAVAFSTAPRVVQSPTRDREIVRAGLADVQPGGGTRTGDALDLAIKTARRPSRPGAKPPPAAIVLLTDGVSTAGKDPLQIAHDAGRLKVPIYTVALGTPNGTIRVKEKGGRVVTKRVPPDPNTLRRIAELSHAQAFSAQDTARLEQVYQRLGSQIAKEPQPREVTAAVAAGALVAMLIGGLTSLRFFGRLP
jgi:Ca-activated chloride channel homolog